MKNRPVCLLSMLIFSVSICIGQTQSQMQDILYLKNGSIIKGTIVEFIPETTVKIQTSEGNIFVYTMAEVEKITKEQKSGLIPAEPPELQNGQRPPSRNIGNGSGFVLFGGVSLPVGEFAAATGMQAGAAKTGFAVGADGSLALIPPLAWMSSVNLSVNSLDLSSALQGTGFSADAGSWTSVWALTGFKVYGNASENVELFGFGQAGVLFGNIPEITLRLGTASATQSSASATAFGFGFGGGVTVGRVSVGVRYVSGEPEYKISASGPGGTASGKYKQPTSCLQITGGLAF